MKNTSRAFAAAFGSIWAILPEKLDAILTFLQMRADGTLSIDEKTLEEMERRNIEAAARTAAANSNGSVAVLPVYGTITQRATMMSQFSGGTSTERLSSQLADAVNNPAVKAIVLDVDSPGGTVVGVPELADQIFQARGKKPITAVSNGLMASAAYWLGSAAGDLAVTPSGQVGSIGVFCAHEDMSAALEMEGIRPTLVSAGKYKVEGNPYAPLSPEAKAAMQAMVDDYYGMFTRSVAKGRNADVASVRGGMGEGRMVSASQAVKLGMADRVATLDQVLAGYGISRGAAKQPMSGALESPMLSAIRRQIELASN